MAAPVTPILDNFNRTESPLANGANWGEFRGTAAPKTGATNGSVLSIALNAATIRGAIWHTVWGKGHHQAYCKVPKIGSNWLELWVCEESEAAGYSLEWVPGVSPAGTWVILKNHGSVVEKAGELEANDRVWIDYQESTGIVRGYREKAGSGTWTEVIKYEDGAKLTHGGKVGWAARCNTAEWQLDDFGGGAVAAVTAPGSQSNAKNKLITPLIIKGTNMHTLAATNLPAGLELVKKSETEWEVKGTPTIEKGATTVTLEAEAEGGGPETAEFSWTITAEEAGGGGGGGGFGSVTGLQMAIDFNGWGGFGTRLHNMVHFTRTTHLETAEFLIEKEAEFSSLGTRVGVALEGTGGTIGSINAAEFAAKAVAFFKKFGPEGTYWATHTELAVRHFEVLNEPWGNWFWSDPTNYTAYINLCKVVKEAFAAEFVQSKRPYVLMSYGDGGHTSFGREIAKKGGYVNADMVVVHPYGGSEDQYGGAEGDRALVEEAHEKSGLPVAVTELGWPAPASFGTTGDSHGWEESVQASSIRSFAKWSNEKGYVSVFSYYGSIDSGASGGYGVYYHSLVAKLGATALKEATVESPGNGWLEEGSEEHEAHKTSILTGGLSFAGKVPRKTVRGKASALSFVGVAARASSRALSGALSFTGTFAKGRFHAMSLSGGLSFTGSVKKSSTYLTNAVLSFLAELGKIKNGGATAFVKELAANLSFRSSKSIVNLLPWPSFEHGIANPFVGQESESSISPEFPFFGTHSLRVIGKGGVSTFLIYKSGGLSAAVVPAAEGTLYTFSAYSLAETVSRHWKVTIVFYHGAGIFAEVSRSSHEATEAAPGLWSRNSITALAPATTTGIGIELLWFGAETGEIHFLDGLQITASNKEEPYADGDLPGYTWLGEAGNSETVADSPVVAIARSLKGANSFSGAVAKVSLKAPASALSFAGSVVRKPIKVFTGEGSFAGSITRKSTYAMTGEGSFVGSVSRAAKRALSGSVSFSGVLSYGSALIQELSAVLGFTGLTTRNVGKVRKSVLSPEGTTARATSRFLKDELGFAAFIGRGGGMVMSSALSFTGKINRSSIRALSAGLALGGKKTQAIKRSLPQASLEPSGNITRASRYLLIGELGFSGVANRLTARAVSSGVSFAGAIKRVSGRSLTAGLSFVGKLPFGSKHLTMILQGELGFQGHIKRSFRRTLKSALSFIGSERHGARKKITLVLEEPGIEMVILEIPPEAVKSSGFATVRR